MMRCIRFVLKALICITVAAVAANVTWSYLLEDQLGILVSKRYIYFYAYIPSYIWWLADAFLGSLFWFWGYDGIESVTKAVLSILLCMRTA